MKTNFKLLLTSIILILIGAVFTVMELYLVSEHGAINSIPSYISPIPMLIAVVGIFFRLASLPKNNKKNIQRSFLVVLVLLGPVVMLIECIPHDAVRYSFAIFSPYITLLIFETFVRDRFTSLKHKIE